MRTITMYLASIILVFSISIANAQETTSTSNNSEKIEILKELKEKIQTDYEKKVSNAKQKIKT
jgi:hypothetical protein